MNYLKKFLPLFAILALTVSIGIINFVPGTTLTGWDNLHPELNILLNIKRSLFAVWQEYQSLGLLGGMGHASDLVRQILLLPLLAVIPAMYIRYVWTILTLFIGATGVFYLIRMIVDDARLNIRIQKELLSFTGAVFYLLNLATVQSYYIPFETFTSHFAALPWMFLATFKFMNKQSRKNTLLLLLIFFLATPGSYVPTLFAVFILASFILFFSSGMFLVMRHKTLALLKIAVKYYSVVFLANSFWLLPFLYFTFTNSSANLTAKINQMATPQIILQNKEFGNIRDVALLKGFLFNSVEPNLDKVNTFVMLPWKTYLSSPFVFFIGFLIFGVIILGLFSSFRKRTPVLIGIASLFIFSFTMLANNTFPLSFIDNLFTKLPLASEAFRFPYTKFSILASLTYALLFVIGLDYGVSIVLKLTSKVSRNFSKMIPQILLSIALLAIVIFTLPIFTGHLFYEKEQIKRPGEYQKVFDFFENKPSDARILTLPMPTFWSWEYYSWGYGGSGFLWYGIKQPIVDRAFDPWSRSSEDAYNTISYAIYTKNAHLLSDVLNKYQISYLLLDKNIYSNSSPKSLQFEDTKKLFENISSIKIAAVYNNIEIYKVENNNKTQNFLFSDRILPSVNSYLYSNDDTAFEEIGNYKTTGNPSIIYPLNSLYSNKAFTNTLKVTEDENALHLVTTLPDIKNYILTLPSPLAERRIPSEFVINKSDQNTTISLKNMPITAYINGEKVLETKTSIIPLFDLLSIQPGTTISVSGGKDIPLDDENKNKTFFLENGNNNYITLKQPGADPLTVTVTNEDLKELDTTTSALINAKKGSTFTINVPVITTENQTFSAKDLQDVNDCNTIRNGKINKKIVGSIIELTSTNDSVCPSVFSPTLLHSQGYLLKVTGNNISGLPLHFWVLNNNNGITPIDINLGKNRTNSYIFLPPQENDGAGYSFHFDNVSIGNLKTINEFSRLQVMPIPFDSLKNIKISKNMNTSGKKAAFSSSHPNESLYIVNFKDQPSKQTTLILSQSYDPGWKAYMSKFKNPNSKFKSFLLQAFPFIFGKEVKTHVKVNNWENGWEINSQLATPNSQFVIVYLPQYLEYLGFVLLLTPLLLILSSKFLKLGKKADNYFYKKSEILKQKIKVEKEKKS